MGELGRLKGCIGLYGGIPKTGIFLCGEWVYLPAFGGLAHIVHRSRYMGEGVGGEVVHMLVSNLSITLFVSLSRSL